WILYNPESDLLIMTPLGNITLYQNSILVPTILGAREVELYLVAGQGTFDSYGIEGATFAVRTPASRYVLADAGEMLVISSDTEESVTSFFGIIDSYNKIYDASTELVPFDKLYMHRYDRIADEIQRGYYLTYGTFPSAEQAYQAQADRATVLQARQPVAVEVPMAPAVAVATEPVLVVEELVVAVEEEPAVEEELLVAVEEEPALEEEAVRVALLTTDEADRKERGSVRLEAGYRFDWDGDDTFTHTLFAIPSFALGSFDIGLQLELSTQDFTNFTVPFYPAPAGKVDTFNYIFAHLHHLRIGQVGSWFQLDISESANNQNLLGSFFAPTLQSAGKLGIRNTVRIGSFTLDAYMDDLRLAAFQKNKKQYAAGALHYRASERYPLTISVGALADATRSKEINIYPAIGMRLPIVSKERAQLALVVEAQSYLPIYPSFQLDEFIDIKYPQVFRNYLVGGGISLDVGPFHTKILASTSDGQNRPYLVNDFSSAGAGGYSGEDFNLTAELFWVGKNLETKLVWNFPLTKQFTLATLTADSSREADYSQFSVALQLGNFGLGVGLQNIGVIGAIRDVIDGTEKPLSLLNGKYTQSFAQVSYTFGPAELAVSAHYPLDLSAASAATPEISVGAKIQLDKRF
ncbi:MAG TPA: hypothetical protein VFC80_01815, partial [Sphaerochaeta sp.]|nr:hypothetical protein [Sphaerochaeta sp.]